MKKLGLLITLLLFIVMCYAQTIMPVPIVMPSGGGGSISDAEGKGIALLFAIIIFLLFVGHIIAAYHSKIRGMWSFKWYEFTNTLAGIGFMALGVIYIYL